MQQFINSLSIIYTVKAKPYAVKYEANNDWLCQYKFLNADLSLNPLNHYEQALRAWQSKTI